MYTRQIAGTIYVCRKRGTRKMPKVIKEDSYVYTYIIKPATSAGQISFRTRSITFPPSMIGKRVHIVIQEVEEKKEPEKVKLPNWMLPKGDLDKTV